MHDDQEDQDNPAPKLSRKELAKKLRREAYQRAKEIKKNDPREIARKAQAKEQRRAAYQKAKEKSKAARLEKKEKVDLKEHVVRAVELDNRPLAPVISLDSVRKKAAGKKPVLLDDI
jgi:hypothetical protein